MEMSKQVSFSINGRDLDGCASYVVYSLQRLLAFVLGVAFVLFLPFPKVVNQVGTYCVSNFYSA